MKSKPTLKGEDYLVRPDTDTDYETYTNHEEQTNESLCFQLGFKPHEDEYFGDGYQIM